MEWLKQKTTWAGIGAIVAAASGFFTGSMLPAEALQLGISGLLAIFLRQGIAKGVK